MLNCFTKKKVKVFIPQPCFQDDCFLVSFPRSGVTWLSFMLAHCHSYQSGLNIPVTFYNLTRLIPDVMDSPNIRPEPLQFPGFRIIKSHSGFDRTYRNIIYLLRDPLESLGSYHNYLGSLNHFEGSLEDFINNKRYGLKAWINHVEGWLLQSSPSQRIMVVRYDDLQKDALKEISRIYSLFGLTLDPEVGAASVFSHDLQKMRKLESQFRENNPIYKTKFNGNFIRNSESSVVTKLLDKSVWVNLAAPYRERLLKLGFTL